jgi:protein-S-isoprenylcysteine O-methyltransferase Ste14
VVKLPPPAWAFLYLVAASALSWMYPWRRLIDLRIVWLSVALIAIGFAIAFWAISLFRLGGTELNPTSETNKSLIIRGPYRFTRNPVYFGA